MQNKNEIGRSNEQSQQQNIPEIKENPNQRANENIDTRNADHESNEAPGLAKVGTEITDGEDG